MKRLMICASFVGLLALSWNFGFERSQADAVKMGIARALIEFNPELRKTLKAEGLLTRDARVKERKKYGQKGARKRFQFSKR